MRVHASLSKKSTDLLFFCWVKAVILRALSCITIFINNKFSNIFLFKNNNKQAGVTLIELIITIVVLGIALSALISSLSIGIGRSAQPMLESKALELSQAYLDEILAMSFDDQTPTGGGEVLAAQSPCALSEEGQSREFYDDVDDYDGVSDTPPVLIDSTIDMSRYANYQVDISVACAGTDLGLDSDDMAKRITITLTVPSGETRIVAIYKGNF
ncbi:MAG: type II secretion system protein [Bermanella sp.]